LGYWVVVGVLRAARCVLLASASDVGVPGRGNSTRESARTTRTWQVCPLFALSVCIANTQRNRQ